MLDASEQLPGWCDSDVTGPGEPCERYFPGYQPIVDLISGATTGHEALARTRNPTGQLQSAAALFFDTRLAPERVLHIDRQMRRQALAYFARHPEAGFLTLNISPGWVDRSAGLDLSPTLQMIEQEGIDPQRVIIEITERQGNLDNLRRFAREYQRQGVRVAIDDFGSGASQVDRVIALEPELIKLDMGLFKAASRGGVAADMALSITAMAKRTGCKIVCEGVETERELHFAIECGADYVQGWLYNPALARPAPAAASVELTARYKASYLHAKSDRYRQSLDHQEAVFTQIYALSNYLTNPRSRTPKSSDIHRAMAQLGVLRYYLCDARGNQASPNYELVSNGVVIRSEYAGRNWSHRPYFPLLNGMRAAHQNTVVTSDPYRDLGQGVMCKTCAVWLSEQLILLVDVAVSDVILFAA